jgi:hypothetical protein
MLEFMIDDAMEFLSDIYETMSDYQKNRADEMDISINQKKTV